MLVKDYIEILRTLPQEMQVITYGELGMSMSAPCAIVVHAAEDGDGVVRTKVPGHGKDYVVVG